MGKVSKKALIQAIKGSGGIVSNVARKLGISWSTAEIHINKYPEAISAFKDEKEAILDMAENELFKKVKAGSEPMIKYILSTKGKERGYTERTEVTGKDGAPVSVNLSHLTDEQLEALAAIYEKESE